MNKMNKGSWNELKKALRDKFGKTPWGTEVIGRVYNDKRKVGRRIKGCTSKLKEVVEYGKELGYNIIVKNEIYGEFVIFFEN